MNLVYIGSYSAGVQAYQRDGSRLPHVAGVHVPGASYLIADGPALFAVNELDEGAVTSVAIEGLRPLSTQPTGGIHPCHLALHDGHLITANYTSGSVSVHPVLADGLLGERTDLVVHEGSGPDPERQEHAHAHQVAIADDGTVAVLDLGIDRIVRYRLEHGRLHPLGATELPPGTGPRHVAALPSGTWRVVGERDSHIHGAGDPVPTTGLTADGNLPSAIKYHDGFVYVANRGANTIATFEVGPHDTLTRIGELPCGGDWPRDMSIVEGVLFVAHQRSNDVVAFRLDPATGLPDPTGDRVSLDSPACVLAGQPDHT